MGAFDNQREFAKALRALKGWMEAKSNEEFAQRAFGLASESSGARRVKGDLGKKRNNPEGRREQAEALIRKTGCPPEIFGLHEDDLFRPSHGEAQDSAGDLRSLEAALKLERAERQEFEAETHRRLARLERRGEEPGN